MRIAVVIKKRRICVLLQNGAVWPLQILTAGWGARTARAVAGTAGVVFFDIEARPLI